MLSLCKLFLFLTLYLLIKREVALEIHTSGNDLNKWGCLNKRVPVTIRVVSSVRPSATDRPTPPLPRHSSPPTSPTRSFFMVINFLLFFTRVFLQRDFKVYTCKLWHLLIQVQLRLWTCSRNRISRLVELLNTYNFVIWIKKPINGNLALLRC